MARAISIYSTNETHFAFLGYAKNFRQTPARRQLDYLRILGGSKEAAKELKLFRLSGFLTERFTKLSDQIYEENVSLSRRKLIAEGIIAEPRGLAQRSPNPFPNGFVPDP